MKKVIGIVLLNLAVFMTILVYFNVNYPEKEGLITLCMAFFGIIYLFVLSKILKINFKDLEPLNKTILIGIVLSMLAVGIMAGIEHFMGIDFNELL